MTYLLLNMTLLHWAGVYLDAIFVHVVYFTIQNLVLARLERNYIKTNVKDDIASGVLHNAFQIIVFCIEVIPNDLNYVAELFRALTDELLVNSKIIDKFS